MKGKKKVKNEKRKWYENGEKRWDKKNIGETQCSQKYNE